MNNNINKTIETDRSNHQADDGREIANSIRNQHDEISLRDLILKLIDWWKYLLGKGIVILVLSVFGSSLGFSYALLKKPIYIAQLSFALEDETSSGGLGGAALGIAGQFGLDLGGMGGGGAFSGDNLLHLIRSRSMVEKTLLTTVEIDNKHKTLAELYIDFNSLRNKWADKPTLKNIKFSVNSDRSEFSLQQDSLLGEFYKELIAENLSVEKIDKKLSIIAINVSSKNELFSKLFVEVITAKVSEFYVDTKTKKSVKNIRILQYQTDSVRGALNSAIAGVATSSDVNPNANPSRQVLRVPSLRRQVDVQANQAILNELVKNLEVSKISLRKEIPLIQVIDEPILPLEKIKFGKLKGIVFGGFLAGFLTVLILIFRRILKKLMRRNETER